ncbi:MAG: GNAT family N-acetyltransferase [Clostridia bacterium]|nr:GNAT family N-acetyltransferase [Clostridia bacterium]
MNSLSFRRAELSDALSAAALADKMWSPSDDREEEFRCLISSPESAVFLAEADGEAVGFAQCGLRHDYVEGKDSDGPVGYLEGIFVEEAWRGRGVARMLLTFCEDWARGMGCEEFASDTELHNEEGLRFHLSCGFEEAGRIICFLKKL